MAWSRASLSLLGLLFTSGALVMMFLTLLGGARNRNPLNQIYFLQVDTSNIPGAPSLSRWTFWNLCAVNDRGRSECGPSHPDYPFDPPSHRTFNTVTNIPSQFIGTSHYFLTSRFMFPFLIIALFFAVSSLLTGLLAICTSIGGFLSALTLWIALIFQTITTCLMTAVYVQGRRNFNRNGQSARLGAKAFAFMWTSVALLFLSSVFYCLAGAFGRKRDTGYTGREHRRRGFFSTQREVTEKVSTETAT